MVTADGTTDVLRVALPEAAGHSLRRAFERLPTVEEDLETLLAGLLRAATHLPLDAVAALLRFRAAPKGPAALVVTGMPIDEQLPPTPTEAVDASFKPGHVSECAILLIAIILGEPVAYAGEKRGALVQNVFPTRAQRTTSSNESSAVALDFHTELTFSAAVPAESFDVAAPDFVLLLGLRSPPERSATTSIVEAHDLCEELARADLATLREPLFQLRAPVSFMSDPDGERPWSPPLALVRGTAESPRLVFDTACGVRALSPAADAALAALRSACADPAIQRAIQLGPGDLLALDNNRCAHARSRYDARFDGNDRWLQRAYVRRSIRGLTARSAESFRVLA